MLTSNHKTLSLCAMALALGLLGCSPAGVAPGNSTSANASGAPVHPGPKQVDLGKVASVSGMIYSVDENSLLLMTERSTLRFNLPIPASKQESKGVHLSELKQGDRVLVHIRYADKGMDVESFEFLSKSKGGGPAHSYVKPGVPNPHLTGMPMTRPATANATQAAPANTSLATPANASLATPEQEPAAGTPTNSP